MNFAASIVTSRYVGMNDWGCLESLVLLIGIVIFLRIFLLPFGEAFMSILGDVFKIGK